MIQVYSTVNDLQQKIREKRALGKRIGFVPTMGALHAGHLSLIRRAREENDIVVCSIFVNPTQFNNSLDLASYPRMPEADLRLLQSVSCDYAFVPSIPEIYPEGLILLDIDFGDLESVMEGVYRPGHFKGMATVVHRLFSIVQPHHAYFGEKDFQQLAIVKAMVRQLHLPVEITGCETLREEDGLAMSSRNALLSPEQRKAAPLIYKGLIMVKQLIPHHTPPAITELVKRFINQSPLLSVQYFEIVDPIRLTSLDSWEGVREVQGCIAVLTEGPRLIDTMHYHL